MPVWFPDLITILIALLLVAVNGFFVAAEFALVKVRLGRIEQMVLDRKLFSRTAFRLSARDHDGVPGVGNDWRARFRKVD